MFSVVSSERLVLHSGCSRFWLWTDVQQCTSLQWRRVTGLQGCHTPWTGPTQPGPPSASDRRINAQQHKIEH